MVLTMTGPAYPGEAISGFEWNEDRSERVAVHYDRYEDAIEDECREALLRPGGIRQLLEEKLEAEREVIRSEAISAFLGEVMQSRNKELTFFQIAFACNLLIGMTMASAAREFGVSKQAMEQGVESHRQRLGLGQNRGMRGAASRELMRLTNFRPRRPNFRPGRPFPPVVKK